MTRFSLFLLFAFLPALCASQDRAHVVRPEIRNGDAWTYRGRNDLGPGIEIYDLRIGNSDGRTIQAIAVRKSDGREFDATFTSEWNPVVSITGLIYSPPPGYFMFPMRPGDARRIVFSATRPRTNQPPTRYEADVKVVGWEEVAVTAGKFQAIRVAIEGVRFLPRGSEKFSSTYWYAPEVRRWVKFLHVFPNFESEGKLLEYKLNEN